MQDGRRFRLQRRLLHGLLQRLSVDSSRCRATRVSAWVAHFALTSCGFRLTIIGPRRAIRPAVDGRTKRSEKDRLRLAGRYGYPTRSISLSQGRA